MSKTRGKLSKSIKISDDLELGNIIVPDIAKDIIYPDELNHFLRNKIQSLTRENGILHTTLSANELRLNDSESKVSALNSQLQEYQHVLPKTGFLNSPSNVASSKIVELSKKLREKTAEAEVYKTKCSKLEHNILENEQNQKNEVPVPVEEQPAHELENQIRFLQEKLNHVTTKLFDTKNSNTQLKNDLKLANKVLQQEVGDTFESIQAMVNANSNWRGRAQIVCDLQKKNQDLREKLKTYTDIEKGSAVQKMQNQTKTEKRMDTISKENENLKSLLQETKRRLDSTKARCKVLDSECTVLKTKFVTITEQNEKDRELISTLTVQLTNYRENCNDSLKQKQNCISKVEEHNRNLQLELSREKCKAENLQMIINEKIKEVGDLHDKINTGRPVTSVRNENDKILCRLEAERLRLVELIDVTNKRLQSERDAHANLQAQYRAERKRVAKLDSKLARLQLEQNSSKGSSYSTHSEKLTDVNTLEDRLELAEENIKALETRVYIEQQERQNDLQEFSKIVQSYDYIHRNADTY